MSKLKNKLKKHNSKYASIIASETGFSEGYVRQVLGGDRSNDKIVEYAIKMLKQLERKQSKINDLFN